MENVPLVTPKLGQTIRWSDEIQNDLWWKELEAMSLDQNNK